MKIGTLVKVKHAISCTKIINWVPGAPTDGSPYWMYYNDIVIMDNDYFVFLGHHESKKLTRTIGCFLSSTHGIVWCTKDNFAEV